MITNKIFQPPSDRVIRAGFFTSIPIESIGMKVWTKENEGLSAESAAAEQAGSPAEASTFDKSSVDKSAQAGTIFTIRLPL